MGGEAGIGKTRLVTELARRARAGDMEVLIGGCLDLEVGGVPYAPVVEALSDLGRPAGRRGAGRRPPVPRRPTSSGPSAARLGLVSGDDSGARGALEGQTTTLQAVERVLERLTTHVRPVLLIVEDVHWADRSTSDLIAYLASLEPTASAGARRDLPQRRPDDRTPAAAASRRARTPRPHVEHLARSSASAGPTPSALLAAVLGTPPDPALTEAIFRRSEGNPFFLEELARAASPAGRVGGEVPPLRQRA